MKEFLFLPVAVFFVISSAVGQNILNNNDFELYDFLPSASGQVNNCMNWDAVEATPDYYNISSYPPVYSIPMGIYSGSFMIGIGTYGLVTGGAESIGQNISVNPIVNGAQYEFGVYTRQVTEFTGGCVGLELYGFNGVPADGAGIDHVSGYPGANLLWSSTNIIDTLWHKVSGNFVSTGSYNYVVLSLSNGPSCDQYVYLDSVYLNASLSLSENETIGVLVYPNPVQNILRFSSPWFKFNSDELQIELYDINGMIVNSEYWIESEALRVNTSNIENGVYYLKVKTSGQQFTQKIIVNH